MSASLSGVLRAASLAVRDAGDELNRLDAVAGDGDLGVTMDVAAETILGLLPEAAQLPPEAALRRVGMEIARHASSTAGTLVSTALLAASRVEPMMDESVIARVARCARAAQLAIENRGHATLGDKTMLDAIDPLVRSLEESASAGRTLEEALALAADAAREGAEHTRLLRARVGRAGWLADRSQGAEDAGAHLVALVAEAVSRHVAETSASISG